MNQFIPPKGNLVNLVLSNEDKKKIEKRLKRRKQIVVDTRVQTDLLLIATGVYSPLKGFMGQEDYTRVINDMHLSNGTLWSLPITLPVDKETASKLKEGEEIGLTDESGKLLGVLFLKEKYLYDKLKEAELVFRTTDEKHPGVARLLSQGEVLLGGEIRLIERPAAPFPNYYYDPVEMRRIISEMGWKTVVAFQTRNPIHRAHEYIQKCALELVDGLLIHPLVGHTKADDVPADVRIKSYEALLENYYPQERTMLGVFPAYMRYAGPREAVFHAICRRNYGCTHMIVGRDHAGVGNYYGTYDAQKLLLSLPSEELGITPLCFEHSFYCKACGSMASEKTCPHTNEDRLILSGTKVREMLRNGQELPAEFSRKEVAAILREAYNNNHGSKQQDAKMNLDIVDLIEAGYFDLHIHSTASDGIHSPRDLVKMAKASGLKTIAITDHDTLEGIEEAQQAGLEYGVNIVAGIELSTKYKGRNVDILGYHVSESDELTGILSSMREGREQRAVRIIEKFTELGIPITLEDVKQFSKGNVIARPHIAMAVVQKGYVPDYQTVFDDYLADGKPCALDKMILSVEEGISLIHRAGGKAVLAHPLLLGDDELVRELMQFPFDGIEVWHRKQVDEDIARYQRLAKEFQLIMTGGSDFHHDEHTLGQFGLKWDQGIQAESSSAIVVWQKTKVEKLDRNQLNGHKSFILWFTGLSGAGKSTLAVEIEKEFFQHGIRCFLLDGDNVRHGLNKNLSFNPEDRTENIRRIGEVSKLFVEAGLIAIAASISPYIADRAMVRSLVPEGDFIEVYVKCSIEECERRDPKGLYKKSRAGEIKGFTGISAPYEPPVHSEITIETDKLSIGDGVEVILHYLQDKGYLPEPRTVDADGPLDHD